MKTPNLKNHSVWVLTTGALLFSFVTAQAYAAGTRNAIFNGDFLQGQAGWNVVGPLNIDIREDRRMVEDRPDSQLTVRHAGLTENMTMYGQYPIGVEPGRTYTLHLTASGEGQIAFGVYEYNENRKNTVFPLTEPIALTPEYQTYIFTYEASEEAASIRPRVLFFGKTKRMFYEPEAAHAGPIEVRLRNFELRVSQEEFLASTAWPGWAVSDEFRTYTGMSEEQVRAIREAVTVDRVLPPYTPIRQLEENEFALTTSNWRFEDSVFPTAISIQGEPVLAGPMVFEVQTADGQSLVAGEGAFSLTGDEQEIVVQQTLAGEDCTLSLKGTLFYDGLIVYDLTLKTDREMTLGSASLTIPLRADIARYIRYNQPQADYSHIFGYGPIPEAGEAVETRVVIGRAQVENDWNPPVPPAHGTLWTWNRGVPRYFWIGDEAKGLGWITESDRGWHGDAGDVTWQLERRPGVLAARMHFITRPTVVRDEWTIRFILQALPPKPVRPDWVRLRFNRFWNNHPPAHMRYLERIEATMEQSPARLEADPPAEVRYAQAWTRQGEQPLRPAWRSLKRRGIRDIGLLHYDLWSVGCSSPQVEDPELFRRYLRAGEYVGHRTLPYFAPTHMAANDLQAFHYAGRNDDWAPLPRGRDTARYFKVCPNSFSADYLAYEIGRLIDEYGIEGVYFDNTGVSACANRGHGCGWEDQGGAIQPTYPFMAMRRFFMLVRNEFVKRGREPFIWKHAGMYPGAVSFVDAQFDGEGLYGYDHTEMITPAEWRASWIGPNQFGVLEVYLSQLNARTDSTGPSSSQQIALGTRPLLAMALIHGTPVFNWNVDYEVMAQVWEVLDELDAPRIDFVPYWQWAYNEELNKRKLYAALYRQDEQAVLVLANLSADDAAVAIPRQELARWVPGFQTAVDRMDDEPLELDEETLRLRVLNKNFRLITLR